MHLNVNLLSRLTILLIYRPPKLNSVFFSEIHDLLTTLCSNTGNILILGDFNIHIDTPSCYTAAEFLQLLDCLNLQQYVDVPTHSRGHTLDLVISNSSPISNLLVYDLGVSDHKVISMELPLPCSQNKKKCNVFQEFEKDQPGLLNIRSSASLCWVGWLLQ